jgi:hypothetical protein
MLWRRHHNAGDSMPPTPAVLETTCSNNRPFLCRILYVTFRLRYEPEYLSSIALGYSLDDRGFESWQGLGIFLFSIASKPALEPTQHPIQWVSGISPWE